MRQTTKKLLDRLRTTDPGVYLVGGAQLPSGGEVIHLHGNHVLVIDEDAAHPNVSFDELTSVGANVHIASWSVHEDGVLDEIAATSLAMRASCCRK